MKCKQCGKVPLAGNIEDWDKYICPDCTAAILERLEEILVNHGMDLDYCNKNDCDFIGNCGLCAAFYIQYGRMITEEDVKK